MPRQSIPNSSRFQLDGRWYTREQPGVIEGTRWFPRYPRSYPLGIVAEILPKSVRQIRPPLLERIRRRVGILRNSEDTERTSMEQHDREPSMTPTETPFYQWGIPYFEEWTHGMLQCPWCGTSNARVPLESWKGDFVDAIAQRHIPPTEVQRVIRINGQWWWNNKQQWKHQNERNRSVLYRTEEDTGESAYRHRGYYACSLQCLEKWVQWEERYGRRRAFWRAYPTWM